MLDLRSARFEANRFGGLARLELDGRVRVGEDYWDVDAHGLPAREIEVLLPARGMVQGRIVLVPRPGSVPTAAAGRCAIVLAGQVASAAAAAHRRPTAGPGSGNRVPSR